MRKRKTGPAPHCPNCGYSLFALPKPRCPECGFKSRSSADAVQPRDWQRDMHRSGPGRNISRHALATLAFVSPLAGAATLLASAISFHLFLLPAVPALLIAVPLAHYQWSAGVPAWKVWLPVGTLWAGLGLLLLSF
jgi:ribosomal protein L37E